MIQWIHTSKASDFAEKIPSVQHRHPTLVFLQRKQIFCLLNFSTERRTLNIGIKHFREHLCAE